MELIGIKNDGLREVIGKIFIARVMWSKIEGSTMADMHNEYMAEDVAFCDTYENAIEQALPFCRKKSEWMHAHGYTQEAHATIEVRMEYVTSKKHKEEE